MNYPPHTTEIVLSILSVLLGLTLGLILENYALKKIRKWAERTKWKHDEIIVDSLKGMLVLWFFFGGVYLAIYLLPLPERFETISYNAIFIIAVLSVTIFLSRVTVGFIKEFLRSTEDKLPSTSIFTVLSRVLIFFIGGMIILQYFNISITPMLATLGVIGLAVALALQDTLSNLFAGLSVVVSKQIKPGNYIKLDSGDEGYVEDITWRYTTIKSLPNNIIVIPNSKMASSIITNYHMPDKEMAVLINIGVDYNSDLKNVEKVTCEVGKEVMKRVTGGVPTFDPFIRYNDFADSCVKFTVILRGKEFVDQYLVKHEFLKSLHERYRKEGIVIPYPIRTVYMNRVPNTGTEGPRKVQAKVVRGSKANATEAPS